MSFMQIGIPLFFSSLGLTVAGQGGKDGGEIRPSAFAGKFYPESASVLKLAIEQFLPPRKLDEIIGCQFEVTRAGQSFDVIPLPHPSGASPWHRMEPGKSLLQRALKLIAAHPAFREMREKAWRGKSGGQCPE